MGTINTAQATMPTQAGTSLELSEPVLSWLMASVTIVIFSLKTAELEASPVL
jgi:hypothetical protein